MEDIGTTDKEIPEGLDPKSWSFEQLSFLTSSGSDIYSTEEDRRLDLAGEEVLKLLEECYRERIWLKSTGLGDQKNDFYGLKVDRPGGKVSFTVLLPKDKYRGIFSFMSKKGTGYEVRENDTFTPTGGPVYVDIVMTFEQVDRIFERAEKLLKEKSEVERGAGRTRASVTGVLKSKK